MDSTQTWFESPPLCALATLWKWSKSDGVKKFHHFSLKSTLSVCQSLWVHKQQHSWIPTKLGTKHPWCVLIHSCEYELILRPKNFHFFFVLSVCFQLKSVTLGSLITSAYHHGFHPNSNRVTPTMCSSYPVKMSKICGIKKYHLLCVFSQTVTQKCNIWVTYNYYECSWIPTKLGTEHPRCVFIHSCEYELVLRPPKNITPSLVLSVWFFS